VQFSEMGMVFSGILKGKGIAMTCLFVQIRCRPGTAYDVAAQIVMREIHSELYSTSGDFDLMMKLYLPNDEDIGLFINDNLLNIDGIERTYTIQTFKAF
jgi:DNA-binding Lrp family transcriptional regulator